MPISVNQCKDIRRVVQSAKLTFYRLAGLVMLNHWFYDTPRISRAGLRHIAASPIGVFGQPLDSASSGWNIPNHIVSRNIHRVAVLLFLLTRLTIGQTCSANLPQPLITFAGKENYRDSYGDAYTRYKIPVSNWLAFPADLFAAASDLPPCGGNTSSSRSWVNIYTGSGAYLYGFCALQTPGDLSNIYFGLPQGETPPASVVVTIQDRRCNRTVSTSPAPIGISSAPRNIGLFVGSNTGSIVDGQLKAVSNGQQDAQKIRDALDRYMHFSASGVLRLNYDDSHNYSTFRDKLVLMSRGMSAEDTFVLYYSGHGAMEGSYHALAIGSDAQVDSTTLAEWLKQNLPAQANKIVILDACYSGGFWKDALDGVPNTLLMAATDPSTEGYRYPSGNSIYTSHLVAGLAPISNASSTAVADKDKNGLTFMELNAYAAANMWLEQPQFKGVNLPVSAAAAREGYGQWTSVTAAAYGGEGMLGTGCDSQLNTSPAAFGAAGGSASIAVDTRPVCPWGAASNSNWIRLDDTAAFGSATISYDVSPNPLQQPRTGTVTVADQDTHIIQKAASMQQMFADVPLTNLFADHITLLKLSDITTGCGDSSFCPDSATTRAEMAAFLVRALFGNGAFPYPTTPFFVDVTSTHPFFRYIQKLRELNITLGCSTVEYCPEASVTRAQMAAFLIRTRFGLGPAGDFSSPPRAIFTDVYKTNPFFPFIQQLRTLGITTGCGASIYCPDDPTTRGQMAVFIIRALRTPGRGDRGGGLLTPIPLLPHPSTVLNVMPRAVTLQWSVVPGAVSYILDIDTQTPMGAWCSETIGCSLQSYSVATNTDTRTFTNPGIVRWRVQAQDAQKQTSNLSDWRELRFLQ